MTNLTRGDSNIEDAEVFLEVMIELRHALFMKDSEKYHKIIDELYKVLPSPAIRESSLLTLQEVSDITGYPYQTVAKKARGEWKFATIYKDHRLMFYEGFIPRLIKESKIIKGGKR